MAANLDTHTKEDRQVEKRTRIRKPKKYRKNLSRGAKRPDLMNKRVTEVDPDMKKTDKNDLDLSLRSRYSSISERLMRSNEYPLLHTSAVTPKRLKFDVDILSGAGIDKIPPTITNYHFSSFSTLYSAFSDFRREVHGVYLDNTLRDINWADSQDYKFVRIVDQVVSRAHPEFNVKIAGFHSNFIGFLALTKYSYKSSPAEYTSIKRSCTEYLRFLNPVFFALDKTVKKEFQQWKYIMEQSSMVNLDAFGKFLDSYGKTKLAGLISNNPVVSNDDVINILYKAGFYSSLASKIQNELVGPYLDVDEDLVEIYEDIIDGRKEEAWVKFEKEFESRGDTKDVVSLLNKIMGVFVYKIIADDFLDKYLKGSEDPFEQKPEIAVANAAKLSDWDKTYRKDILKLAREKVINQEINEYLMEMDFDPPEQGDWSDPRQLAKQMVQPDRVPGFITRSESLKSEYEDTRKRLSEKYDKGEMSLDDYEAEIIKLNRDVGMLSLKNLIRSKRASSYALNEKLSTGMNTRISTYHGIDDRDFYPIPTDILWYRRYFNKQDEKVILAAAKDMLKQDWCKYGWTGGAQDAPFRSALDMTIATIENAKYAGRIEARLYDVLLNKLMGGKSDPFTDTLFVEDQTRTTRKQASMENRVATAAVPLSTLVRVAFENPGTRSVLLPIIAAASKKPKKAAPKAKDEPKKAAPKEKDEPKKAAPKEKDEPKKASPKDKETAKKATPKAKKRKASSNTITVEDINWV